MSGSEDEFDPGRIPTPEQERIYLEEIERDPVRQVERAYYEAKDPRVVLDVPFTEADLKVCKALAEEQAEIFQLLFSRG